MAVTGHAWIVGAGPGDPGLMTRRAMACLRRADLVCYDALVDARVMARVRRGRRVFVGKRAGRHAMTQEAINRLLVRAVRRGQQVVRLKGGDPFVFGRGGEEALALEAAGLPYSVVPGVSSALAAPAAVGIPVTHRGVAGAVLVVAGHSLDALREAVDAAVPARVTLVVLMGMARLTGIASVLHDRGWPADTPAAVVVGAWTDGQASWRGTLGALGASGGVVAAAFSTDAPGTLVVGGVAALRCGGAEAVGESRASIAEQVPEGDLGRLYGAR